MNARISFFVASLSLFVALRSEAAGTKTTTQRPEVAIGERLFLETRFAQAFFAQCNGDVNAVNIPGDPALNELQTPGSPIGGPFKGKTMNCRQCHLEDDALNAPGGGMRTYADFARRSPIPDRGDGKTVTTRNSPALVAASLPRQFFFLHFDAEFATPQDLVIGGFTGRNFGWLASEHDAAIKHIANVIRNDNGQGDLAKLFGGSYAKVLAADKSVPVQFRLPAKYRMHVGMSSDAKIMACVENLVTAYLQSLDFSRDTTGAYNGSPYDLFLVKNSLPRVPNPNETNLDYSRRLRAAVNALTAPVFVTPAEGTFTSHAQPFQFGADELAGLRLFLAEPAPPTPGAPGTPPPPGPRSSGNCIACHSGPNFTDFAFHNTGVSQLEYDGIFGAGAFGKLAIPSLAERTANPTNVLPANATHPAYTGNFKSIPTAGSPGLVDLGLWNIFENPDYPTPQKTLTKLAVSAFGNLTPDALLAQTVATFKTPGLRDLGHSQPYQHNGSLDGTRDVLDFYVRVGQMQRAGQLRNGDRRLGGIALSPMEALQVAKFLDSLNEDFHD